MDEVKMKFSRNYRDLNIYLLTKDLHLHMYMIIILPNALLLPICY